MLIAATQITKFYGSQDLLQNANFHIHFGEKVGLIGPNGSGKSTLLKILLGEIKPDEGEIHRARHVQIGYLPQDVMVFRGRRVLDQVLEVEEEARFLEREIEAIEQEFERTEEHDRENLALRLALFLERYAFLGGYELQPRAEKILEGLGFASEDFDRPVETLSGGWAMRVALARLLMSAPDLMLLDEPTNHLDLDALCWLEEYLTQISSAVLVVSHDPRFLNGLVSRIVEFHDGGLLSYSGDFDFYWQEKGKREEITAAAYRTQQEQIRQIKRFIEKNRVRKDRARQVQSRIRALEKMERIEPPRKMEQIHFCFPSAPPSGRLTVSLENLTHQFDGKALFSGASLALYRGDKVAILGPNGSGKSTLLRILAGQLEPLEGFRRIGSGVKLAYFGQHQMDLLRPDRTVLEEASDSISRPNQGELRSFLGAFRFSGESVFKPVKVLSEGEKSRLMLCQVILREANLLLLDEPTNHLDIHSRGVLEKALEHFDGTLCLVTHDRRLMDAVANHVLVMQPGGWELLPGNYRDCQEIWKNRRFQPSLPGENQSVSKKKRQKRLKRAEADWRNRFSRLRMPIQQAIEHIEYDVEKATQRIEEIQAAMADPQLYRCSDRVQALQREHAELRSRLETLTEAWEARIEELQSLELQMDRERPQ